MSRAEIEALVLNETGVTTLRDGTTAVNVGPIVAALHFLTEGRGEDRGTDEHGQPLPDLMSLAFDVVQSIILGGRKAEFFRRVKQELDAFSEAAGQSSLTLAKRAERVERPAGPSALDDAADELRALLGRAGQLALDADATGDVKQALESFRDFGADRWVSATAQLLIAARALAPSLRTEPPPAARKTRPKRRAKRTAPTPLVVAKRRASKPPIKAKPETKALAKAKPEAQAKPKTKATRRAQAKPKTKAKPPKPLARKKSSARGRHA